LKLSLSLDRCVPKLSSGADKSFDRGRFEPPTTYTETLLVAKVDFFEVGALIKFCSSLLLTGAAAGSLLLDRSTVSCNGCIRLCAY